MTTEKDIGKLITHSPKVRGGRDTVTGTGVSVVRVVNLYKIGLSPEEIAQEIGHLTLAQVHAALAYYHSNKKEIENSIEAFKKSSEKIEREYSRKQKAG